ncbi:MAG: glycosyltransferase family 4 protein [candidate division NC10 bacterium]|nr:glycosyltransferase family 4 protein [candidate division NC10 bacterium]
MVRIVHIITRLDVGGSTENTVISATRMPGAEFTGSIVSGATADPPPGLSETLSRAGVAWIQVPHLRRLVSPVADCRALWQLRRVLRRVPPDIVHTHSSKAGFLGRVAARAAGVPHILHTPHGHIFEGYFSPVTTRVFLALERVAARFTDRIITLSDAEARDHLRHGIGRPEQFVTIPSGVDLDGVQAAMPVRLVSGGPVIGVIARLTPIKGLNYLIDAVPQILQRCPEARFLLVGDGETRAALEAQAGALRLGDRITFAGFREDVPSIMAGMDIVALPSLNEGMGRVLVMAMALGKPIVATRVGGVAELLGDGEAGLLVPARDSAALAEAIGTLLQDPARAAALGEAGRRRAPRYSAQAMLDALAKVYREVTADGRSR